MARALPSTGMRPQPIRSSNQERERQLAPLLESATLGSPAVSQAAVAVPDSGTGAGQSLGVANPKGKTEVTAGDSRPLRILVVDDQESVLRVMRRILTAAGFEVTATTSCSGARELLETDEFDLLVSDLHMGVSESGLTIAHAARSCARAIPVVVVTGSHCMATGGLTDWSEVSEVVLKPFTPGKLVAACQLAIGADRAKDEL